MRRRSQKNGRARRGSFPWDSPRTLPRFHPSRGLRDLPKRDTPVEASRANFGIEQPRALNNRIPRVGSSKDHFCRNGTAPGPAKRNAPGKFCRAAHASSSEIPPPGNRTQRWPPLSDSDKNRLPDNPIVEVQIRRFHQLTGFSLNWRVTPSPAQTGQHLTEPDNLRRVLRREKPPGPRKPPGRTLNAEALCYRP